MSGIRSLMWVFCCTFSPVLNGGSAHLSHKHSVGSFDSSSAVPAVYSSLTLDAAMITILEGVKKKTPLQGIGKWKHMASI